ncbi:MAG: MBL fold metallo-hydrolase [Acidimicrobiia bacterium]
MRFTIIGHSCLYVETSAGTILVDPWLSGSCYWRSWWHYPPTQDAAPAWLAPDYVYLTHHHFDHFHFPSMRRIDRRTHVLVPKFGIDVMAGEVRALDFHEVMELPHGQVVQLGPRVRVASYQYGADDTVFVVADGNDVLVDVNDSKIRGRALRHIRDEFGTPTFVFKSYSFAQAYPTCYTADDPDDLTLVTRDDYIRDWLSVVGELEPRYGVPFGSMVAFLHPESRHVNRHLVTPQDVVRAFAHERPNATTEAVQMDPGDRWSSAGGFERSGIDWYVDRDRRLDELAAEVQPKIDAQTIAEKGVTLEYAQFATYLQGFLDVFRSVLLRRALPRRPIVFKVPASLLPFWVLDFGRGAVYRLSEPPPDVASIIEVNDAVLADAIEKRLLHVVHGSMRIHVHVLPGGAGDDLTFWALLVPWELGYLPLRRSVSPRLAEVVWRRRREWLEWADALRSGGSGSLFERLSGRFTTTASSDARAGRHREQAGSRGLDLVGDEKV